MFFRNLFSSRKAVLTSLEQRLIGVLTEELPIGAAKLLLEQLEQVNLVQRLFKQKEVNLYACHGGRTLYNEPSLFPLKSEAKLATIKFHCIAVDEVFTVEVWIVNGHIFSLQFSQTPKMCSKTGIEVLSVKIHVDPLNPTSLDHPTISVTELHGWLSDWGEQGLVANARKPLSREKYDELLVEIDAELPADYLEIVGQSDGLTLDGWRIFGLSEIRTVVDPNRNYYILAEKEGFGVVSVICSYRTGELHYIDFESNMDRLVGRSLKAFIEGMATEPLK